MSLKSVQSKLTTFGLTLSLVLGVVSPVFIAQVANATSAGTNDCIQDYSLTSGTGTVSVSKLNGYCYIAFKNTGGASSAATFSWTPPSTSIDYLVVAGGGGGASRHAGGGGAGGLLYSTNLSVDRGVALTMTVGAGGSGASAQPAGVGADGSNGANSSLSGGRVSTILAYGGGAGAFSTKTAINSGGSGGGAGCCTNTPGSGVAGQGNSGSNGTYGSNYWVGGGGGGAGGAGADATGTSASDAKAGNGGPGLSINWIGTDVQSALTVGAVSSSTVYFAGGGGGATAASGTGGSGGVGGGGNGASNSGTPTSGAATTGAGGGAAGLNSDNTSNAAGSGGSGVIVIRYAISDCSVTPDTSSSSGYTILKFTNVGTCSWSVPSGVTRADILIVAGGGSGGGGIGGGGGAGEFIELSNQDLTSYTGRVPITVGAGGAVTNSWTKGLAGSNSSIGSITAYGGGGGGSDRTTGPVASINNFGSEGGGGFLNTSYSGTDPQPLLGVATRSDGITGYRNNGGAGSGGGGGNATAGGGGGAGGVGAAGTSSPQSGGNGGAGRASTITGASVCYAAGGGGGLNGSWGFSSGNPGNGGNCGGSAVGGSGGAKSTNAGSDTYGNRGDGTNGTVNSNGSAGAANSGSGGGGASNWSSGGAGGSGIVVIKYVNAPAIALSSTLISATIGSAINSYAISSTGGPASNYSIPSADTTALTSAGISFNTSTGVISGTPSAVMASRSITITATNTSGTATATFSISSYYVSCTSSQDTSTMAGYSILKFTSTGTCSWQVPAGVTNVDVLVVGGGGGGGGTGGRGWSGGGGAGGQVASSNSKTVISQSQITVKVGAGGAGGSATARTSADVAKSGDSSIFGDITASGGGAGGHAMVTDYTTNDISAPTNGGGGGAQANQFGGAAYTWNSAISGGNGYLSSDSLTQSAGGGAGAGGSGSSGTSSRGGDGGSGSISNITGSNVSYAGGGGGGKRKANTSSAGSGKDGGGNGGQEAAGSNATANTGGGGGGAGGDPAGFVGGNGGSGVVIVRYALVVTYSYDLNSATSGSAPISGSAQGGTSFTTAASTGIAKTNYTFGGWCSTQPAIGAACSGTLLTANASQTMPVSASSITFYAVWTGNSQTITYANGGGTGSAPASPTSAVYGSTFTVPANPYLKNGYSFTGWSDGTNTYQPGATYPSSGSVSTNITLTAQWSSCGSSVIQAGLLVHLDAGNTCSTTGSTAAWKDISSNGNNASLQNSPTFEATLRGKYYTFGNGTTASTSSTGQYATLANGVSDFSTGFTFSFFASFSASAPANETILSFGSSQGYGTNEITVYRDSNNTLTVYTSNWNGFCSSYNNYLSNGTFRHYAITWTPGGDCSFYLDGVLNKTVTPGIQVGKTNAITGNRAVANIGRAISGSISYFGGSIGDIAIYNTPLSASDVKSNYLAQIDASTSVTYNGNNNTGGSVPTDGASPYLNGSTVKVLANTGNLAKTGYTFNGWCTAQPSAGATCASVSGTSYAGTGSATFTIGTSNVTLYAIWAPSITLTAADQLKTYTGSAVSVSNTVSLTSGTLSGSDAFTSSSGTYTYVGINGTTYASSTTAPTAMGTYSITPSAVTFTTGSASNYGITYVAGTLTITYASCSVTPVISGGKKTYSFTSTGSCSWTVPAGITKADILVVGAGGGGGNDNGGGGGGGQVKDNLDVSLSSGAVVTITVGTGGLPGCAAYSYTTSDNSDLTSGCKGSVNTGGNTGGSSSFAGGSTITSLGGNGAVGRTRTGTAASGWDTNGYNGGGVGIGQTSIPTASGNAGGSKSSDDTASGGGGGAGGVGTAGANSSKGGAGGSGTTSSITGVCYGGGGGGGSNNGTPGTASCGGAAGTGTSARSNASANLGGGGGGGGNVGGVNGGTGGSGLVVIQYITTVTVTPTTSVSTMSYGTSTGFPTTSYSTSPSVTLTTAPTCNYYASADSTFATPVTLSATTAVGSYVVHCTGAAYTTNSATIAYASDATFTVTDNAPGAPTITGITTSSGQLSVAFTAGSNTGTSITKYQYSTDGGSTWRDRASGTTASPLVISTISGAANSSLVNGTSYPVQIRAFNTVAGTASSTTSASSGATTATLSGIQIKGSAATLGTPASSIGSVVAGTITLSQLAAIDTSNSGSYVTSLTKSDSNSTTKIVKYASGVATSSFGSDVAYTTAGISDQDFFIVRVVAQDGLTTSYYKVTVTVSAPVIASSTTIANGASGASLVITGNGFKSNIATSDLTTSVGTTGLTVSSVTYNSATQITVGLTGTAVVGTVTVQVKAAGFALATSAASNTLSYVVPNSAVSTLSALVVSAGTISPTFSSGTTSYTLSVATGITSTTVTATRTQANAAITVNGSAATSGTATGSISLAYGSNTITVVVTAQDGTTTSTYTVTITRASTVPAQPAITGATIGDGQISVNVLSNGDGGSAITNWKYSTNGGTSYTAVSPASTSTTIAITGLTNGTAYSVKVIAVNANGDSLGSSAVSYTPYGVPAAPTSVVITPGNTQLSVAFTAGSDNGSAITNYWYSLNGGTYVAVSPTQTTSPIVITGLTNGTSYSVALKAQNARGLSAASSTVSSTPIAGALTPTFDTPVRTADGFTVNVTNYSNSYTWTSGGATGTGATVTFGTASGSNLPITVSGLAANTSSTLTINNSRSGYGNGTATVSGTSLPTLTVTYDSQGGSAVTSGSTTEGASISAAPTAPTKAGYTFTGWSTTSNGSVVTFPYAHGQTSNFTLYAIWSANALTITYDSQGGTSVTSGTVNTGASISAAPTAPTKAGYTFTGWSTTSNGSVVTFPYAHGQTSNFTLFAIWSVNALTVTFNSKGGSTVTNG
jgi:uncharacterized repeat protein (TIGR02543 family)